MDERKARILSRVPRSGNWAEFEKNSITVKDIAFLSAYCNQEFALLQGKKADILFHGSTEHCDFDNKLTEMLICHKLKLVAHSHPDYDRVRPSKDDREVLRKIGQRESTIISWITGEQITYTQSIFDI